MRKIGQSTVVGAAASTRFDTLAGWLAWAELLHMQEIDLGLDRCRNVAHRLGLTRPDNAVISVAGTNGKGSSVLMLATILEKAGYRVATYTSPHLLQYNERIRIAGRMATDAQLCGAFQRIDDARGEISLTYFEFGTLAALDLFQSTEIDVAILEVGLGGRLDAVNIIDADLALITAIGVDHVTWLGSDRAAIAREKAGICRSGKPSVCSDPDVPKTLQDYTTELGSPLYKLGRDFQYCVDESGQTWSWHGESIVYRDLPKPSLNGEFQLQNAAGVLMAIELLNDQFCVGEDAVRAGLRTLKLAGRLQIIPGAVQYVLDVAHNPHAAQALVKSLKNLPISGRTQILIGMLQDKDCEGVIEVLSGVADGWHLAGLAGPRGASAEHLATQLKSVDSHAPVTTYADVDMGLHGVRSKSQPGDRILVVGSFLTVACALKHLNGQLHLED